MTYENALRVKEGLPSKMVKSKDGSIELEVFVCPNDDEEYRKFISMVYTRRYGNIDEMAKSASMKKDFGLCGISFFNISTLLQRRLKDDGTI